MQDNISVCRPLSNRGAQPTTKTSLTLSVDWLSCTFNLGLDCEAVLSTLHLDLDKFVMQDYSFYGYKSLLEYNGIRVLLDHKDSSFMLDFTGSGCRFYEMLDHCYTWSDVFNILSMYECSFTRIDLALDAFNLNTFNIRTMYKKACRGETKGRFRVFDFHERRNFSDGTVLGETLYFGSPDSRIRFRFYNKLDERVARNYEVNENIKKWIRFEICFRKEHACSVIQLITLKLDTPEGIFFGVLRNYLLFLKPSDSDSNKWRWSVCSWWEHFLKNKEKVRLAQVYVEPTVFKKCGWLNDSVSKTAAFVTMCGEFGIENPLDYNYLGFEKLKENGKREWHILNEFLRSIGRDEIDEVTFYEKVDNYLNEVKEIYIKKDDTSER